MATLPQNTAGRWRGAVDKKTGRIYYYHTKNKEVTWVKPLEMIEEQTKRRERKATRRSVLNQAPPGKVYGEVTPLIENAFHSDGVRFFLNASMVNAMEDMIEKNMYDDARKFLWAAVQSSQSAKTSPIGKAISAQLNQNTSFDMILTIKSLGDAMRIKEKRDSESSISSKTPVSAEKSASLPFQNKTGPPPPVKAGTKGAFPPKPPPAKPMPKEPPRPMPPPAKAVNDRFIPPVPRAPDTNNKPVLPPKPPAKALSLRALPPRHPPPVKSMSGDVNAGAKSVFGLPPIPPPRTPDGNDNDGDFAKESKQPVDGLNDLLAQIKVGKTLRAVKAPSPPPADSSMETALRLKLEDQRQYLAELNESDSYDDMSEWGDE